MHLLASSGLSLPIDIWYPSTEGVKPEISDQVALGTSYLVGEGLLITWEGWYKLDAAEKALGEPQGRERVKLVEREDMLRASGA